MGHLIADANEFDALVMLAYNIGSGGFRQSTVLKIINGKSQKNLREAWGSFIYSRGTIVRGLINRRNSELDIFFKGVYIKI
ncbi:glycoside hydrolase family protein [Enterobacteriaceae bacterium LUAb1]